jgi:hypothetical protein
MMKAIAVSLLLLVFAAASPAFATPNMIRLGYPTCSSCHISPQGGGLLTDYGKGIDAAQNLRPQEIADPGSPESTRQIQLPYDAKFSLSVDRNPPTDAGYSLSSSVRSALVIGHRQYLVYGLSIGAPTLGQTRTTGAMSVRMSKLFWMYQPKDGLSISVGRDDLPTGLGLPGATSFARTTTSPDVSTTPTQAKVFWWNKRWQVSGFAFGPDGNETASRFEAHGGGAIVGANVWKDRAVVGVTSRVSYADAYDRRNASVFLRLGLTEHWGALVEHDVTARETDAGQRLTHLSGHSELFYVPFDWLQTAIGVDDVSTINGAHTIRWSPSAQVRLNRNFAASFSTRDVFTGVASGRSRTYSLQLSLKAVE